jgi:hypothetical protein
MVMGKLPESRQLEFWMTTESLAEATRDVLSDLSIRCWASRSFICLFRDSVSRPFGRAVGC